MIAGIIAAAKIRETAEAIRGLRLRLKHEDAQAASGLD
jgi:hypothetical protein